MNRSKIHHTANLHSNVPISEDDKTQKLKAKVSHRILYFGIRQKVICVLLAVLLLALTFSGWLAMQEEQTAVLKEINQRGSDISRFLAKSLSFSVIGYDYHTIQWLLEEIVASEEISYAKVINQKGKIMGEAGTINDISPYKPVYFTKEIQFEGQTVGYLSLAFNTERSLKRLENQKYNILKREGLIILLIALGEFIALSTIIIRPVTVISKALGEGITQEGEITVNIPINTSDEFGQLAKQFNHLGQQLKEANYQLQTKINVADANLQKTNNILLQQSEELKLMNEKFKQLSITDHLTGLYNRRQFEELIDKEVLMSIRHEDINSLLILDIDHFKSINDSYGHHVGDLVLKEFADMLRQKLRTTDILCRIGGEEFVMFCKRASKDDATLMAQRLRSSVAEHTVHFEDRKLNFTVSIGIATIPDGNGKIDQESFLKQADKALYYCKDHGRNQVMHYDDIPDSGENV